MSRQHMFQRKGSLSARYMDYAQRVVGAERSGIADTQLGMVLTFVAGAVNAGGFLVVGQYTSHMSGIFSALADNLVLGTLSLVLAGLSALVFFILGAACSAILINWGRRRERRDFFALPLMLEAILLFGFGLLGAVLQGTAMFTVIAVLLLCFIMGLQNATVTKISGARIRTTHVTGMITDVGIEFGKLIYWNGAAVKPGAKPVRADQPKLRLLLVLLGSFFAGGVFGAFGFQHWGFATCIPLGLLLLVLASPLLLNGLASRQP